MALELAALAVTLHSRWPVCENVHRHSRVFSCIHRKSTSMCHHPRGTTASPCALTTTPGRGAFPLHRGLMNADVPVTTGGPMLTKSKQTSLRVHFEFTSVSLRRHFKFDLTLISCRFHCDFTSTLLGVTPNPRRTHFRFT